MPSIAPVLPEGVITGLVVALLLNLAQLACDIGSESNRTPNSARRRASACRASYSARRRASWRSSSYSSSMATVERVVNADAEGVWYVEEGAEA
jgi:hypothetical protein